MKQNINETKRMQHLAGIIKESMFDDVNEAEAAEAAVVDNDADLDEMARTANTGGAFTITPEGEAAFKEAFKSRTTPEGLGNRHMEILAWLLKAKKDGKRVQKIDYAKELGVPQPAVNPYFNKLKEKGFVSSENYQSSSAPKTGSSTKASFWDRIDSLDLGMDDELAEAKDKDKEDDK